MEISNYEAKESCTLLNGVYKTDSKGGSAKEIQEALTKLKFKLGICVGYWVKKTTLAISDFALLIVS
ncbi:hypothetical protein [Peribacillus simplex]|uniref:hypothetical protein n=1 Tax=Peribacillus simplex TaxID=1478 RepID=UPI003D2DDAC1